MYDLLWPRTINAFIVLMIFGALLTFVGVFGLLYAATHPKDGMDIPEDWETNRQ